MTVQEAVVAALLMFACAGATALAATPVPALQPGFGSSLRAPEVIVPGDLPAFHAVVRSDSPPAGITAADAPAPMPDADANAPIVAEDGAAQVSPALFNTKTQYRGDGYAPGSTAQDVEERLLTPATGIRVKVPLN